MHCNAIELWEWAVENGIPVSKSLLEQARKVPEEVAPLSVLLAEGGIHRMVGGHSKSEVLREVVAVLPLPPDVDRDFLVTVLEAREAMGSTAVGDGIAIPHVRNPILLHLAQPFVALCLLRNPVPFGAIDGKPVHALFVLVSTSVPQHLRILAQLGHALRDDALRALLASAGPADAILARIAAIEAGAPAAPPSTARRSAK
jgi:PTS system nitrogen regulatory IIA component